MDLRDAVAAASSLRDLYEATKANAFGACKTALIVAISASPPTEVLPQLLGLVQCYWHDVSLPLAYLVLMAIEESSIQLPTTDSLARQTLVSLVLDALDAPTSVDAKVVVKAIEVFNLKDLLDPMSIMAYVTAIESTPATQTSALKCMWLIPELDWPFAATTAALVATKSWSLAEQLLKQSQSSLVRDAHNDLCAVFIELALQANDFKKAHRVVQAYGLHTRFPHVDNWFRQESLQKLCAQRKWGAAVAYVGSNTVLQRYLFDKALIAGELVRAREWHARFGLPSDLLLSLDENSSIAAYMTLPETVTVNLCTTHEDMQRLRTRLEDALRRDDSVYLGIDLEWKPVFSKGDVCLASLLQLALHDSVFLVDLVALEVNVDDFELLQWILEEPRLWKLGYGLRTDLRVLHESFGDIQPDLHVESFVELSAVHPQVKSLSDAVDLVLGKPLDKTQQLSNWDARPLTLAQQTYAALDAWCLVQLAGAVTAEELASNLASLDLTQPSTTAAVVERRRARWDLVASSMALKAATPGPLVAELLATAPEISATVGILHFSAVDTSDASAMCANSLCVFANDRPIIVLLPQSSKLDMGRLAAASSSSRRSVRFATAQECIDVFGYAPGTVPPIAHKVRATVYVDSGLESATTLIVGSGRPKVVLQLTLATLQELCVGLDFAIVPLAKPTATVTPLKPTNADPDINVRFLVDTHLGKLARWLRMRGIDCVKYEPTNTSRSTILDEAATDARIVITTDRKLAQRRAAAACFLVTTTDPRKQLFEVLHHFGLGTSSSVEPKFIHPRCTQCNGDKFTMVDTATAQTKQHLQASTIATVSEFWACDSCGKLFWTAWKRFRDMRFKTS
ncbi:hypothetical protein ACHHYP_20520 [Achlya hypogyna]|uniref:3'-5' exonuclease domain-containing protein n=1 Tax=Achlya hypogyna TaxID=1202772 RepID=A0A1V9YJZ2_ACHHY|nr:hypothetical protein ACHHYP_20520 [Achlya hypogyna]